MNKLSIFCLKGNKIYIILIPSAQKDVQFWQSLSYPISNGSEILIPSFDKSESDFLKDQRISRYVFELFIDMSQLLVFLMNIWGVKIQCRLQNDFEHILLH